MEDVRHRTNLPLMEHIMASAGVPPIGLLHAARALRIYRRHEINALAWIALGVCLRSPAPMAALSVALLIVCAWTLTRHIQHLKPLYELPVFSRVLTHGGMAFAAINAALLGRVKSQRGQHIDMALYDTLVSMHEYAVQCYTLQGVLPEQTGHDMPTSTLYGVFRAADADLVIAAQVDDAWKRFAALVEAHGGPAGFGADKRFHDSVGRNAHRAEILSVVEPWVAARNFNSN